MAQSLSWKRDAEHILTSRTKRERFGGVARRRSLLRTFLHLRLE